MNRRILTSRNWFVCDRGGWVNFAERLGGNERKPFGNLYKYLSVYFFSPEAANLKMVNIVETRGLKAFFSEKHVYHYAHKFARLCSQKSGNCFIFSAVSSLPRNSPVFAARLGSICTLSAEAGSLLTFGTLPGDECDINEPRLHFKPGVVTSVGIDCQRP